MYIFGLGLSVGGLYLIKPPDEGEKPAGGYDLSSTSRTTPPPPVGLPRGQPVPVPSQVEVGEAAIRTSSENGKAIAARAKINPEQVATRAAAAVSSSVPAAEAPARPPRTAGLHMAG